MTGTLGRVAALVPAAGSGQRFGGSKLWAPLGGRPVLAWTLAALADPTCGIDQLVVVAAPADHARVQELAGSVAGRLDCTVVAGGARRQDSVAAGLRACTTALVVVHDAARPLAPPALVAAVLAAARDHGAATAACPAVDTTAVGGPDGLERVLDRTTVMSVQTPQAFRADWLRDAHAAARGANRTADDDAGLVLAIGHPVAVVEGDRRNRKVTDPDDLVMLAAWLGLAPAAS